MTTSIRHTLIPMLAALALTATSGGFALAQTAAHDHGAETPHALTLNNGSKWETDAPLRAGMKNIRELVAPRLDDAHADKLSAAQYKKLAAQIETEVGSIVVNCKLEPAADAVLHVLIADIMQGSDGMAGKNTQMRPVLGLAKVAEAVNQYGNYFDDAGFKPLPAIH